MELKHIKIQEEHYKIAPLVIAHTFIFKKKNMVKLKQKLLVEKVPKHFYLGSGSIIFLLALAAGVDFDFSMAIR